MVSDFECDVDDGDESGNRLDRRCCVVFVVELSKEDMGTSRSTLHHGCLANGTGVVARLLAGR